MPTEIINTVWWLIRASLRGKAPLATETPSNVIPFPPERLQREKPYWQNYYNGDAA